jgi:hypothetical protein
MRRLKLALCAHVAIQACGDVACDCNWGVAGHPTACKRRASRHTLVTWRHTC